MRKYVCVALSGSLLVGGLTGCSDLPGNKETQGAVVGGVAGAAAGALIGGGENRILGTLIGGALGAGGGYLIGSQLDKSDEGSRDQAIKANERAQKSPATAEQARQSNSADVNGDGYVTLDEIVAMEKAGISDDEILNRLKRSDMFFELTDQQKRYLLDNGVSSRVVNSMDTINPDVRRRAEERARQRTTGAGDQSIGRE